MKRLLAMIAVVVGLLWCVARPCAAQDLMTKDQLKALLGSPGLYIIDIRTPEEWSYTFYKVKGAQREMAGDINAWIKKYPTDGTIVVYCA